MCIAAFFLTAGWSGLFDVAKALVYIFSLLTLAILIAGVASFCADNADTALVMRQGVKYKNMPDTGLEPVICGILLVILAISAALLDGPASFCGNYTLYRVHAADPPDPITVCFTRFMLCAFPALAASLWADANNKSFMHVLKVFFAISIIMLSSAIAYLSWAVLCDGNNRIIAGRPEKSDTVICLTLLSSGMSTAITHIIRREHRILSAAVLAIYAAVFFIPVLAGNSEFWREFFSFTYLPSHTMNLTSDI